MEHMSNQLASVTRYASAYTRRLSIDAFFRQWDEDRYLNLGQTLHRNYSQALQIIWDETEAIEQAKQSLGINDQDLARWKIEQSEYLKNCNKEPEWDTLAVAYVELLQKLRALRYVEGMWDLVHLTLTFLLTQERLRVC